MMNFADLPEWVQWLAQDADGIWHPQGVGRGCPRREEAVVGTAAKAATTSL
jgi:hypothetical protein